MSAYSDWHCGAISDDEYRLAYAFDRGEDHGELPPDPEELEDELEGMDLEDQLTYLLGKEKAK